MPVADRSESPLMAPTTCGRSFGESQAQKAAQFTVPNVCLKGTHVDRLSSVKYFTWDDGKNEKQKADRGIGFEEIVFLIGRGHVLDILEHPNHQPYGGQRIFVV